jgi:hypothetical protein
MGKTGEMGPKVMKYRANNPRSGQKSARIAWAFDSVADPVIVPRQMLICSARP